MKSTQKWSYLLILLLVVGAMSVMWMNAQRKKQDPSKNQRNYSNTQKGPTKAEENDGIPEKAYKTWQYIQTHHQAPENYVGGRVFQNREKRLPKMTTQGKKAIYFEWDINPKRKGQNRGPERLVSEEFNRAWYTPDHYNNFIELKN